jgi:hypothetical protein
VEEILELAEKNVIISAVDGNRAAGRSVHRILHDELR